MLCKEAHLDLLGDEEAICIASPVRQVPPPIRNGCTFPRLLPLPQSVRCESFIMNFSWRKTSHAQ